MLHVVLFQPEIPPNTGNIIRLCANTGTRLHLIRPLGFTLDDRRLRRAGLDYGEWTRLEIHADFEAFLARIVPGRCLAFSTRGEVRYDRMSYRPGDALMFGPETRGLPAELLNRVEPGQRLQIPMRPDSRSLNLANAVAVAIYEVCRQWDFAGFAEGGSTRMSAPEG